MATHPRKALTLAGLALLLGCVRSKLLVQSGAYVFHNSPETAVISPPEIGSSDGDIQTATLTLGVGPALGPKLSENTACAWRNRLFSLAPEAHRAGLWKLDSPSVNAWQSSVVQDDADAAWADFLHGIDLLTLRGCFPGNQPSSMMQRCIVEAISIPADRVVRFYYSLSSAGFADLRPGMQIRVEPRPLPGAPPDIDRHSLTTLAVIGRTPTGVTLAVVAKQHAPTALPGNLPLQQFASEPELRVFLEQADTGTEKARKPMLLGAASAGQLDRATTAVMKRGEGACEQLEFPISCFVFQNATVSLLAMIYLNGHKTFFAPGTTLSQVIDAVPAPHRQTALATVTVERQAGQAYYPLTFDRTEDILSKITLVNGDQVRWKR